MEKTSGHLKIKKMSKAREVHETDEWNSGFAFVPSLAVMTAVSLVLLSFVSLERTELESVHHEAEKFQSDLEKKNEETLRKWKQNLYQNESRNLNSELNLDLENLHETD